MTLQYLEELTYTQWKCLYDTLRLCTSLTGPWPVLPEFVMVVGTWALFLPKAHWVWPKSRRSNNIVGLWRIIEGRTLGNRWRQGVQKHCRGKVEKQRKRDVHK